MEDDLLCGALSEGAYFNDMRIPSVEHANVEQSIIGINASWVVPNKYIDHEGMVSLLKMSEVQDHMDQQQSKYRML